MTANKHYTIFTEKRTEHKNLILTVMKVVEEEKKNEVNGDGGFIFNT